MTAHRSGTQVYRTRTFREHIASLKFQIEVEIRTILREDEERRLKQQGSSG